MPHEPDTRPSLIERLQGGADDSAWEEFVVIYRPVIVRLAARRGLQHSDAEDVAQGVLLSVSRSIDRWTLDPDRAKFRAWLRQIVRNAAINAITRRPADRGAGGTTSVRTLDAVADDVGDLPTQFDIEWRREAFRLASDQVRNDVQPATWDAFRMTAIEGLDASEAALRTGRSVGAVYVARCRVMQKIQARVRELIGTDPDDDLKSTIGGGTR